MRPDVTRSRSRQGLTLVEMMVVIAILGGLVGSLVMILQQTSGAYRAGSSVMRLEMRGGRVMRQIARALRTASADSLSPSVAPPFSSNQVQFLCNEGFDGKEATWSGTRRINFDSATGELSWTDDEGGAAEKHVVWARNVPDRLEGEVLNGVDDNANELVDESGLCFCIEDGALVVRLTLSEDLPDGRVMERSWSTRLECRN
jgi:prepilin-type N-terminal cleavage/methylation domain-containing protein